MKRYKGGMRAGVFVLKSKWSTAFDPFALGDSRAALLGITARQRYRFGKKTVSISEV